MCSENCLTTSVTKKDVFANNCESSTTYMSVGSVACASHEDPVRFARLCDVRQEIWSRIVRSQDVGRRRVAVTPTKKRPKFIDFQRILITKIKQKLPL